MVFTAQRFLVSTDDVVRDILSAAGVTVGANLPADLLDRLPYVSAHRFGGEMVDPEHLDRAAVAVDTWADSRRLADDLAETCRVLLYTAWRDQTVHAGATVAHYGESSAPSELRTEGQANGLWRFNAGYSLHIRTI
jgi:hypothetical protein